MRRLSLLASLVAVVLLALVVTPRAPLSRAQESTPEASGHPFVGTWLIDTDTADPESGTGVVTVAADGTYTEVDADGTTGLGAWRPTGEDTADLTLLYPSEEGLAQVRATIEVATDGQAFTATYTFEFVAPDGTGTGEYGPGEAAGTRVEVEAPGTPVGTLEELFAQFAGTPVGTPTS